MGFTNLTMSDHSRCAACRFFGRRCSADCIFAPYFPSTNPERFACVNRIFGARNVARMLQESPVDSRGVTAETLVLEAQLHILDPVYGATGVIRRLEHAIEAARRELDMVEALLDFLKAQAQETESPASDGKSKE